MREWFARALALVTVTVLVSPSIALAQEADRDQTEDGEAIPPVLPLGVLVPDDFLLPEVTLVDAVARDLDAASSSYYEGLASLGGARTELDETVAAVVELRSRRRDIRAELTSARSELAVVTARRDIVVTGLRELAVSAFVGGEDGAKVLLSGVDPSEVLDVERGIELGQVGVDDHVAQLTALDAELDRIRATISDARDVLRTTATATQHELVRAEVLRSDIYLLGLELARRGDRVRAARRLAVVEALGIPVVALDAYAKAAKLANETRPGCRAEWWMFAAVGFIESGHGTAHGSQIDAEGDTTVRIYGIPLDGTNETALIEDSDGGRLDGDPTIDRAVGPMQFIPQAWDALGVDATGDDVADPHNLYDAAASAARYLCRAGGDLGTPEGRRIAYFRYNQSEEYVEAVETTGLSYAEALQLPDPPSVDN